MSRALLVFEDATDGLINFKVTHIDGFDKTSHAHALSIRTVKWLDELSVTRTDVKVNTLPTDDIQNGHGKSAENIEEIRRMASAGKPLI